MSPAKISEECCRGYREALASGCSPLPDNDRNRLEKVGMKLELGAYSNVTPGETRSEAFSRGGRVADEDALIMGQGFRSFFRYSLPSSYPIFRNPSPSA